MSNILRYIASPYQLFGQRTKVGLVDFIPNSEVEVTITLTDSYGDGWNGAVMTITDSEGNVVYESDFTDGSEVITNITLPCAPYDIEVTSGNWPSEISWNLSNANGDLILQGGAPFSGSFNPCELDSDPPILSENRLQISNITYDSFDVSFEPASDESGIAEYQLYISESNNLEGRTDTFLFDTINKTSYASAGTKKVEHGGPGFTYWINIVAVDPLGNKIAYKPARVDLVEDTEPPTSEDVLTLYQDPGTTPELELHHGDVLDNYTGILGVKNMCIVSETHPLDSLQGALDNGYWRGSDNASTEGFVIPQHMKPDTDYYMTVVSYDRFGNFLHFTPIIERIDPNISQPNLTDTTAPEIIESDLEITEYDSNSFRVEFIRAIDDFHVRSQLVYKLYTLKDGDLASTFDIQGNGTLQAQGTDVNSFEVTGLDPNSTYSVVLTVEDPEGNVDNYSQSTVTTVVEEPYNVQTAGLDGEIMVQWDHNMDRKIDGYNVYIDGIKHNSTLISDLKYTASGLNSEQQYEISVIAVDFNGSPSVMSTTKQETATNIAPSVPSNVSITEGDQILEVAWADNTELDLAGYNVYVDGVKDNEALITTSDHPVSGLTNDQQYDVYVTAVDNDGLESDPSTTIQATPTDATPGLQFDGVDDYVETPDDATLDGMSALTIEAQFVIPENNNGNTYNTSFRTIIAKGTHSSQDYGLYARYKYTDDGASIRYIIFIINGEQIRFNSGNAIPTDTRIHVAASASGNGTDLRVYIYNESTSAWELNAHNDNVSTISGIQDTANLLRLGWDGGSDRYLTGTIVYARIWNVERTQQQIEDNLGVFLQGDETGLQLLYNMNVSDDTLLDDSPNNNDGAINGATLIS
jgi:hypothetical protein